MGTIRYEVIHDEDIDFLEGLCNQLMNFQAGGATIHPEIMGSMNYHNRLKPDYAGTERKYLLVAYDAAQPVGFAFAAVGQLSEASLTGKPGWAKELDGVGFYPEGYALPKTIGTFKLLYVDEAYRGLAVGKTLTEMTMQWLCVNDDVEDLWVYVANGNERVGALYEKYGFAHSHSVYNGFIQAYCRKMK